MMEWYPILINGFIGINPRLSWSRLGEIRLHTIYSENLTDRQLSWRSKHEAMFV